jgi:hypothetical protein
MDEKKWAGWIYTERRDNAAKHHPMRPYRELTEEDKKTEIVTRSKVIRSCCGRVDATQSG